MTFSLLAGFYAMALLSALVPWVNGELVMLAAVPLAPTTTGMAAAVAVVTAGQMTGKAAMYWLARTRQPSTDGRIGRALVALGSRLDRTRAAAPLLVFVSALVGLPPFYAVSLLAGSTRMAFGGFVAAGTLGRLLHFGVVGFAPLWARSA